MEEFERGIKGKTGDMERLRKRFVGIDKAKEGVERLEGVYTSFLQECSKEMKRLSLMLNELPEGAGVKYVKELITIPTMNIDELLPKLNVLGELIELRLESLGTMEVPREVELKSPEKGQVDAIVDLEKVEKADKVLEWYEEKGLVREKEKEEDEAREALVRKRVVETDSLTVIKETERPVKAHGGALEELLREYKRIHQTEDEDERTKAHKVFFSRLRDSSPSTWLPEPREAMRARVEALHEAPKKGRGRTAVASESPIEAKSPVVRPKVEMEPIMETAKETAVADSSLMKMNLPAQKSLGREPMGIVKEAMMKRWFRRIWTEEENRKFEELVKTGKTDEEIAQELGRTKTSILTHKSFLGLSKKPTMKLHELSEIERGELIELIIGEGCFHFRENKYPAFSICMADKGTIEKIAEWLGTKIQKWSSTKVGTQLWGIEVRGEKVLELYNTLKPYLSAEKREQAEGVIAKSREAGYMSRREQREFFKAKIEEELGRSSKNISKRELARRTGFSLFTIRKYYPK